MAENLGLKNKYILHIRLNRESYAIPLKDITKIQQLDNIIPTPIMPHYMRGIIQYEGNIFPVIDLCTKLTGNNADYSLNKCIFFDFIFEGSPFPLAILVEEILGVFHINGDSVNKRSKFIFHEGDFLKMIDLQNILPPTTLSEIYDALQLVPNPN